MRSLRILAVVATTSWVVTRAVSACTFMARPIVVTGRSAPVIFEARLKP